MLSSYCSMFTLANGTVPERFWTGSDHLAGTVRFGTVPRPFTLRKNRSGTVLEPYHRVV